MHDHSQPHNTTDSAGFPWQGRSFEQHSDAFANDQGETPPELAEALAAFRAGEIGQQDVLRVFATSRLLIPLLTVAGDVGLTPDGRTVDKTQELSIVTVQAPDGRSVLPVFSSVAAMQRWNPEARPVPNYGRNVAVAALDDGNSLVILDPTTPETEFGLRRPALWALAQGAEGVPCWQDAAVQGEFEASVSGEDAVNSVTLSCGDPEARLIAPELLVSLGLRAGLAQDDLAALTTRLQQRWAASEVIADRVDSIALRIAAAS